MLAVSLVSFGVTLWAYLAPRTDAVSAPRSANLERGRSVGRPTDRATGQSKSPPIYWPTFHLGDLLGEPSDGAHYRRANSPRRFVFPRDHGPHYGFQSEWWYFTGNLATDSGRRFGYQFTVFRFELGGRTQLVTNDVSGAGSAAGDGRAGRVQLYLGHFSVTDVDSALFYAFELAGRGDLGTGGAQAVPFRVWVGDWDMSAVPPSGEVPTRDTDDEVRDVGLGALRIRARVGDARIALELRPEKAVVAHGDRGLSRKSKAPGRASYYYSVPRWEAAGEIELGSERWQVQGRSWLDREWSTSALGPDQIGWDWFGLQLDDGTDLMFYALRTRDGARDILSAGTLVGPNGTTRGITNDEVSIEVKRYWTSPQGVSYPAQWRLRLADSMDISVTPLVADQLWAGLVEYWEGAVQVSGNHQGQDVTGFGYVELTGYRGAASEERRE